MPFLLYFAVPVIERYIRKESSNGELQVLGKFDSPAHVWKFDAERKLLCAGLRDGTVGLVRILDEE